MPEVAQQDENFAWAIYWIIGIAGIMFVIPFLYVICGGDTIRKTMWNAYNTEARQEKREAAHDRRAPRVASCMAMPSERRMETVGGSEGRGRGRGC